MLPLGSERRALPSLIEFCLIKIHQAERTMCSFLLRWDEGVREKNSKNSIVNRSAQRSKKLFVLLTINGIFSMNELGVWCEELLSFWSGFVISLSQIFTQCPEQFRSFKWFYSVRSFYWRRALRTAAEGIKALNLFRGTILPSTRILHHKNFFSLLFLFRKCGNFHSQTLNSMELFLWFAQKSSKSGTDAFHYGLIRRKIFIVLRVFAPSALMSFL